MATPDDFNAILDETFEYTKNLARDFYFNTWANNPPECLAFNGEVVRSIESGQKHFYSVIRRGSVEEEG